jgi:hypothetical protein
MLLDLHLPSLADEAGQCMALLFPKPPEPASGAATTGATPAKAVRFAGGDHATAAAVSAAPDPAGAEVQSTVASLFAGLEGELLGLIEAAKPGRLLLCLPMLGATLAWKQRLEARGPVARPLVALLGSCQRRLAALLEEYFAERAAAVQRCGRVSAAAIQLSHDAGISVSAASVVSPEHAC